MRDMHLEIEYVPISELNPYENNAKIHTPEQIEQIKSSIEEFGMNDPIAVWGENNTIVEGHGRLIALQQLGADKAPIIRLDALTDEERRAYALVHNQLTMETDFDYNILDNELMEIGEIDMSAYGFELNEISADDFGDEFTLDADDKPKSRTITLSLVDSQYEIASSCIEAMCARRQFEDNGASNKNGNAVAAMAEEWWRANGD